MAAILNAFTQEMNDIRGEELHFWRQRLDGSSTGSSTTATLNAYRRYSKSEPDDTLKSLAASLEDNG